MDVRDIVMEAALEAVMAHAMVRVTHLARVIVLGPAQEIVLATVMVLALVIAADQRGS